MLSAEQELPFAGKKRRVYHPWKKGQVTQEVFKDVVGSRRKKIREAKIN